MRENELHVLFPPPSEYPYFIDLSIPARRMFSEGCANAVKRILGKIDGNTRK